MMPMLKAEPASGQTSSPPSATVSDCTADCQGPALVTQKQSLVHTGWLQLQTSSRQHGRALQGPDPLASTRHRCSAAGRFAQLAQLTKWSEDIRMWASGYWSMKGSGFFSLHHRQG